MDGWMVRWMDGCMKRSADEYMYERINGLMGGLIDGRTDRQMNRQIK